MLEVDWFDLRQTRTSGLNHVLHSSLLLHCLVFKEHRAGCLSQLLYNTPNYYFCQLVSWKLLKTFKQAGCHRLTTCIMLHEFLLFVNDFI